ncbi:MAG: TIGR03905 family TSCPD domain-containing protein, partial [Deltaproteobacteria bacterium]|nr:TIGR03905 family TSCPD domain-containing protein [Deltaproteobacteria bacterium]
MKHTFRLKNVCPKALSFELKDGLIDKIEFSGGCPGNLIAIAKLASGEEALKVARRLKDVPCGSKTASCPDELAKCIYKAVKKSGAKKNGDSENGEAASGKK